MFESIARKDTCFCGVADPSVCPSTSGDYSLTRVEAFCFASPSPSRVALNFFWSAAQEDNVLSTADSLPNYVRVRRECYVEAAPSEGLIPLLLFKSPNGRRFRNAATPQAQRAALEAGYESDGPVGYVKPCSVSKFSVDMRAGTFAAAVGVDGAVATVVAYAHRVRRNVLVYETSLSNSASSPAFATFASITAAPSDDVDLTPPVCDVARCLANGTNRVPERAGDGNTAFSLAWVPPPQNLSAPPEGRTARAAVLAVALSLEGHADVLAAATEALDGALEDPLLAQAHAQAWEAIWATGDVEIAGDLKLQQAVRSSFYYIIASLREDWPYG
jgi:hypothetical protein